MNALSAPSTVADNRAVALVRAELLNRFCLVPTEEWLTSFLSTTRIPPPPIPTLASTASFRILNTDFTTTLSHASRTESSTSTATLPLGLDDVNVKQTVLQHATPVQVLDILDTSTSLYAQIEAIERVERGEEIRGREVIRTIPGITENTDQRGDDIDDENISSGRPAINSVNASRNVSGSSYATALATGKKGSTGPHKLLLQDAAGRKIWAFELARIDKITIINSDPPLPVRGAAQQPTPAPTQPPAEGMLIGTKILLKKSTAIRRGLVMLTPATTQLLGGKVEQWDTEWRKARKARLKEQLSRSGSA